MDPLIGAVSRCTLFDAAMAFTFANNGQIPQDSSQILPYLKENVDPVTIQKYFKPITTDIAANNPPLSPKIVLAPVFRAYESANNGQDPENLAGLLPYITSPNQKAALKKLEQEIQLTK
jgi:hypothetical protein